MPRHTPRSRPDGKGGFFERQLRGSDAPLPGKCGSKLPKTNPPRYCTRPAGWGTDHPHAGACKKHFGRVNNSGENHYRYRDGLKSKYRHLLPNGPLLDGYLATLSDDNLRTLREQIALADGLAQELVVQIAEDAGGAHTVLEAQRVYRALREAMAKGTEGAAEVTALIERLGTILLGAVAAARARLDLQETLELIRRLRDSEGKLAERERRMIAYDELGSWLQGVGQVVIFVIEQVAEKQLSVAEGRKLFAAKVRTLVAANTEPRLHIG